MSRRHFVCLAATASLLPTGLPSAAGTVAPGWSMRLSTSSIHFLDLPLEQACERIAALGFEAIDIWSAYDKCPHLDDVQKRLGPEGLKNLLARHKLKLCAFSVYHGGYARYADLLGKVGGGVAIQGSAPPAAPGQLTGRMRAFFEGLKPLVELAEARNSWLAIENHGQALLDSLDSIKAFVELNPFQRVGLALAPYHLQIQKAPVPEAIRIAGPQLLFFYAWQNEPGLKQLPGHGSTNMKPWLEALAEVNYKGYVNPFMHGRLPADEMSSALTKARDYLNSQWPPATSGKKIE